MSANDIRAGGAFVEISARLGGLEAGLRRALGKMRAFGDKFQAIGVRIAASGAAVTAAMLAGVKSAGEFSKQMAAVGTLIVKPNQLLPGLSAGLRKLSVQFGQNAETLSKGLFDIVSAGVPASEALGVLSASARLAVSGITETGLAADAVTTVLNSYGLSATSAGRAADFLFQTQKSGKITVAQIAEGIGKVASTARASGLSLDELGAAIATMTRNGVSADNVMRSLRSVLNIFLRPSKQSADAAQKFGVELNTTTLKTQGLAGVMRKLRKASAEQAATILGSTVAVAGFLPLLNDLEGFSRDVSAQQRAAGASMKAFGVVSGSTGFKLDQLRESLADVVRAVGLALTGPTLKMTGLLKGLAAASAKWIEQNSGLVRSIAGLAIGAAGLGAAFIAVGLAIKLALSGTFLMTAGFLAIAASALAVTDTLGVTKTGFGDLFNSIRVGGTGLATWFGAFFILVESGWSELVSSLTILWDAFWTGVKGVGRTALSVILFIPQKILEAFSFAFQKIADAVNGIISAYNRLAGAVGLKPIEFNVVNKGFAGQDAAALQRIRQSLSASQANDEAALAARRDSLLSTRAARERELNARTKALFLADPQDASKGARLDTPRARAAFEKIGNNIFDGLASLLKKTQGLPGLQKLGVLSKTPFKAPDVRSTGPVAAAARPSLSAVGTFSAAAAGSIASSGLVQNQLDETRKGNDLLKGIFNNTRDLNPGLA